MEVFGVARGNSLDCMFCVGTCTCNKKPTASKPKVTKPSPPPEAPVAQAAPTPPPVTPPAPQRPSFASIKRVNRPIATVTAPVLQPELPPEPVHVPVQRTPPRPPARPTVQPPTRAARPNLASVRRVPTNPEAEAERLAIQVLVDAGFTVERL